MEKINNLTKIYPQCFTADFVEFELNRCGDGWYPLVFDFVRKLASHNTYIRNKAKKEWLSVNPDKPFYMDWIQISCIKEKFGSLRIYVNNSDSFISGLVVMAETMSNHFCEDCGTNQHLVICKPWIRNLCEPCAVIWKNKQASRNASEVTYKRKEEQFSSPLQLPFQINSDFFNSEEYKEYEEWKVLQDLKRKEEVVINSWWQKLSKEERKNLDEKYKEKTLREMWINEGKELIN